MCVHEIRKLKSKDLGFFIACIFSIDFIGIFKISIILIKIQLLIIKPSNSLNLVIINFPDFLNRNVLIRNNDLFLNLFNFVSNQSIFTNTLK